MRLMPSLLFLAFIVLGCSPQAGSGNSGRGSAENSHQMTPAPDFDLRDLKGEKISLSKFKGKVVFIDFWATWCSPCVIATPHIEKLHEDYKSKNVEIISISVDSNEEIVRRFVERYGITTRVALALQSGVDEQYRVQGIPAFFLINTEGNIVNVWEGYTPYMSSLWRKELDRLLGV